MLGDDGYQFLPGLLYFLGGNQDVRRLSLGSAQRLMNQHAGVGECGALALLAGAEQHRTHGCGHPRADGSHVRSHKLHRIVDSKT